MEKVAKQIKIILLCLVMYVVDFFIAPLTFPFFYPEGNEAYFILFISIFGISLLGMLAISKCMFYWLVGDMLYCSMILMFLNEGLYGIGCAFSFGYWGDTFTREYVPFDLIFVFILVVIIQSVAEIVALVIKWLQKLMQED